jgi:CTP:molybdopterin cytidylyltransferase MocA
MDVILNINRYYAKGMSTLLIQYSAGSQHGASYGVVCLACDEPCVSVLCCDEATASRLGNTTTSHSYASSCLIYTYTASVVKQGK